MDANVLVVLTVLGLGLGFGFFVTCIAIVALSRDNTAVAKDALTALTTMLSKMIDKFK